jgi:hypothetical protein
MRLSRLLNLGCGVGLGVAVLGSATAARADSMDPALGRLVIDDSCRGGRGADGAGQFYDPASGFQRCLPNDAAFAKLIAQLAFALAPTATHTARTTGFGGYSFGIQMAYTTIDSDAHYWKEGTQGPPDESAGKQSTTNLEPDGVLQTYSVQLAKGFPFGVELGAGFGFLANTEIISGGGDVRMALFEGFREWVPGYIPDVGVGGGVRTITGTSELKLTIASFDVQLSKPIPISGTVTIHPHIGYQPIWIFGDSGLIDLTANTDPVTQCGYQGDNNPATPDPSKNGFDGQPNCVSSSADFNNNVVFDKIRLVRHRLNFGVKLRYQMVQLGLSAITDVVAPLDANSDGDTIIENAIVAPCDADNAPASCVRGPSTRVDPTGLSRKKLNRLADDPRTDGDDEVSRQWTIAIDLGAVF